MDIEQLEAVRLIRAMGIEVSVHLRDDGESVVIFSYMGFYLKFIVIDNIEEGIWVEMLPQEPWHRDTEDSRDSMLVNAVAAHFYFFGAAVRFKQSIDSGYSIYELVA